MTQPTGALFDLAPRIFKRGDYKPLVFRFRQAPLPWVSGTSYVQGVVGSTTYLASSTVTYQGISYTCTTANSDVVFTPAHWTVDPNALGPVLDYTDYGPLITGQVRSVPDQNKTVVKLADLVIDQSNHASGILTVTFDDAVWQGLLGVKSAGFDVQASQTDGTRPTTLITMKKFKVFGDFDY